MQLWEIKIGFFQTKPNQTKPNQTKPNQTKPNQTKPNQTKPSIKKLVMPGADVTLKLEIDAEVSSGLDRAKVRTLMENANTLNFTDKSIE